MRHALLAALAFLLLPTRVALAHDPFEVTTKAYVRPTSIELDVTMPRKTALTLAHAQSPGAESFDALEFFELRIAGTRLIARASTFGPAEDGEMVFHVAYARPPGSHLHLDATHLAVLGDGFTSTLDLRQEVPARALGTFILTPGDTSRDVNIDAPHAPITPTTPSASAPPPASAPPSAPTFGFFLRLGVEHILTGYDHLAFLGALLIASRSLRSTLLLISAFTVSHSVTLILAALGWVSLPSVLVESVIALSILVVGLENLLPLKASQHRLALVLGFGLIHGLGFAGALRDTGLDAGHSVSRLFAFNLGVELGQLALALLTYPLLLRLTRSRFGPRALTIVSLAVCLLGACLLVERTLLL